MSNKTKKLIKNKDSLPPWFPLAIYSTELTEEQWLRALVCRATLKTVYKNTQDTEKTKELFQNIIIENKISPNSLLSDEIHPSEVWGIRELPAFEAAYLSAMIYSSDNGRKLITDIEKIRNEKDSRSLWGDKSPKYKQLRKESFGTLINWQAEPYEMQDVMPCFPVIVDLDQDDETLALAFKVWLAGVRQELGPAPKPIDDKEFQSWKKYGLLPIFDLYFWSELHDIRFSDTLVANTIWPDAEFDNAERLRKVTRPKLEETFNWTLITRFWRQLELNKSLEALIKNRKAED